MFIRTQAKGATSELINIESAVCIAHRKWHDTDEFAVTACFTSDRTAQHSVFLTGPMSLAETETVIETICEAIEAGKIILDLRTYGCHHDGRHNAHKDDASAHQSRALNLR
jgi:hypothetical protein